MEVIRIFFDDYLRRAVDDLSLELGEQMLLLVEFYSFITVQVWMGLMMLKMNGKRRGMRRRMVGMMMRVMILRKIVG